MDKKHELESILAQILSMTVDQVVDLAAAIDEVGRAKYGKVEILIKDAGVYRIDKTMQGKPKWIKDG